MKGLKLSKIFSTEVVKGELLVLTMSKENEKNEAKLLISCKQIHWMWQLELLINGKKYKGDVVWQRGVTCAPKHIFFNLQPHLLPIQF